MTTRNASTQAVQAAAADTLLVIGAGEGHDIPPDWQEHYRRLVLVEPLPELARSLRRAFGEQPNVEVLETAIVPDVNAGDTVTLYEFNWTQASSRHQPADLLQLFPGLKTERMRRVSALSPQQLIQEIGLSPEEEHKLILEAPADEGPILAALIESHAYKNFSRIQLRYPVAGLYDTPEDPEAMLQALTACGFEIESQDRTDPDWPSISLIRNRWKIALEEARETIKALEAQLAERAEALNAAEQLAKDRGAELEKLVHARKAQTEALTNLEKQLQDTKANLDTRTQERDEHAKRAKELTEAKTKAEKLAEERGAKISERDQQLKRLQAEEAELRTRLALMQEEMVRAEAQIDLIKDLVLKDESL